MRREFWLERWRQKQIGFHEPSVHPALPEHWPRLGLGGRGLVLVPLCGKSHDMTWLREQGHDVLGVELSDIAAREYFAERGLAPTRARDGPFERYEADRVTILCGDFFDLTPAHLAGVVGIYDRAALIALPTDMREAYAARLRELVARGAKQLLVTLDYPQREMDGPPFGVGEEEVRRHYGRDAAVEVVSRDDILAEEPRFQGRLSRLDEDVFVITPRGA